MKKELLLTIATGLLYTTAAVAQTCTTPPSCETLGFDKTAADCEGQSNLKCPFDLTKFYCLRMDELPDISEPPAPGMIYYSDGTFSSEVVKGKIPVGVVAYLNGSKGLIVALDEMTLAWSTGDEDVSCLENLKNDDVAQSDIQGKSNTACLVGYKGSYSYPAADYCHNYQAVSTGIGSEGWYLPAAGELYVMKFNFTTINLTLKKLSKKEIPSSSGDYWSSSETDMYSKDRAWYVRLSSGSIYTSINKTSTHRVRCVLAF